ncbi:DnaJ-domain-containing protein [Daldinia vernicosa]|uniref:DnaJ-domain-containing protein n=1 Tax=Daldinia vernicosa TaxID=114800 RepID=UPI00200809D7|nr:DnaJ-domain-containing protein [Daldinia vernicosa]KAI0849254.1 DnaJ-domain-containing protein [Daldinia vernicosa]
MAQISFPSHDLYKVLGVENDASLEDIKKAYRELARKVHPDKAEGGNTPENNARFQQVSEAWEILRDEVLRRSKRRSRKERSGSYEAKPNHRGKPYFEEWGHDKPNGPDETRGSRAHGARRRSNTYTYSSPPYDMPYPFEWPGTTPEPQPAPGAHQYRAHNPRGPPPPSVNLADRLTAMRIRVDMRSLYSDLDAIAKEIQYLATGFHSTPFNTSDKERRRWGKLFNDANSTLNVVDDMYDDLDIWVDHIETGRGTSRLPACNLPAQFAYISAIATIMKYAATACVTIQGLILSSPYEPPQQYFDDLEERMRIMITACGSPQKQK